MELTTRAQLDRRGIDHEWTRGKKNEKEGTLKKKKKKKTTKKKKNRRRKFLLGTHVASGDSAVIKARPVARASRPRETNDAGQRTYWNSGRTRKGLLRQVERIACAMVRTSAPRKNEIEPRIEMCRALRTCATLRSFFLSLPSLNALYNPCSLVIELAPLKTFHLLPFCQKPDLITKRIITALFFC